MLSNILAAILPISALANDELLAIASGRHFSFIVERGVVQAMGRNQWGQLGLGNTEDQIVRVDVPFDDKTLVSSVAAGAFHTLFLTESGHVWVAGRNHHGQLGDGTTAATSRLKKLTTVAGVAEVAAGYAHSVFRLMDGSVMTVGLNNAGQLGDGTMDTRREPVNVPFGNHAAGAMVIAQGDSSFSNSSTEEPTTVAPTPMPKTAPPTPAPTPAPTKASAVAAGYDFTYILTEAGELWAMGQNLGGQLGLGFSSPKPRATRVHSAGDMIVDVAAGESHGLFITKGPWGGQPGLCGFGANFDGQLGDASTEKRGTPICSLARTGAKAVAAGGDSSCFADFQLRCFGSNRFGQLGLGSTAAKFYSSAQQVEAVNLADAMALGDTHRLFLNQDDVIIAGSNSYGELGDSTTEPKDTATFLVRLERPERTTAMPLPTPALPPTPTAAPTPATTRGINSEPQGSWDWPW